MGERSVAAWVAGDGISYKNAKKVAELFQVKIDWLWRGREKGETPDPFADPSGSDPDQLTRIERKLDLLLEEAEIQHGEAAEDGGEQDEDRGRERDEAPGG